MLDLRELIHSRIFELLEVIRDDGHFVRVFRNMNEISQGALPAAVLLDAFEETDENDRNKYGLSPRRTEITIPVVVMIDAAPGTVFSALNVLRARVIYAIMTDTELTGLLLNDTGMAYKGCQPLIQNGRKIDGTLTLEFVARYLLKPSDLSP